MQGFWGTVWKRFQKRRLPLFAVYLVLAFGLIGLYAPFFASSKPFFVYYHGWYFPLFRYLFYPGFYTKRLDLFFNLLMFTLPLAIATLFLFKRRFLQVGGFLAVLAAQVGLFF